MVSEPLYRLQLVHTAARVSAITANTRQPPTAPPITGKQTSYQFQVHLLLENHFVTELPSYSTATLPTYRNQTRSQYWSLVWKLCFSIFDWVKENLNGNYNAVNLPIKLFPQVIRWGEATGCVLLSGFLIWAFINLPLFAHCQFRLIATLSFFANNFDC